MLNVKRDLVGKTITGVIAVPGVRRESDAQDWRAPGEIWMMQFSDGSYVEFVSPAAKRGLRRSAKRTSVAGNDSQATPQLALNVA